jgi:hypothetical protein
LQECFDGVANIHIDTEEASIETADDAVEDDIEGVGFIQPTTGGSERVNCGRNKLFLDSACTQHTMYATEYLVN